jgi:hypothetical protein
VVMELVLILTAVSGLYWRLGSVLNIRGAGVCCGGLLSGTSRGLSTHSGQDDSSRESSAR